MAFAAFSIMGLSNDHKEKRKLWFLSVAGIANLVIVYCYVSYWYEDLLKSISHLAALLFVFAIGWELFQAVLDIKSSKQDEDESKKEHLVAVVVGVCLSIGFCLPAYIIAGKAVFRS